MAQQKIFKVEIIETLSRIIEVQAPDSLVAMDKATQQYLKGEVVLDYSDYKDWNAVVLKRQQEENK